MKSSVETLNPTRVKLTVEVPFAELGSSLDAAYKAIARQVNVPGFRKGKAPKAVIDQRVGRGYVLEEAVNSAIPTFYNQAVQEADLRTLGQPAVDVTEFGDGQDLTFTAEVDIRPQFELPAYKEIAVVVDDAEATDSDLDAEIDRLRARFGTLTSVDRPAAEGDFLQVDLVGTVDGEEVDDASVHGFSYEVGSNALGLEEMDGVVVGLSAGESASFTTTLQEGEHAGQEAEMTVTVKQVRERELPEVDDDFAQMASEFDTVAELRDEIRGQIERLKKLEQGVQARDKALEALLESVDLPLPENLVDADIEQHFTDGHGDDAHREEYARGTREALKQQLVLDAIADAEDLTVEQTELADHLVRRAYRAGLTPDDFAQQVAQAGAVGLMVSEVRRGKALALVLENATVTDSSGRPVDLEELTAAPTVFEDETLEDLDDDLDGYLDDESVDDELAEGHAGVEPRD